MNKWSLALVSELNPKHFCSHVFWIKKTWKYEHGMERSHLIQTFLSFSTHKIFGSRGIIPKHPGLHQNLTQSLRSQILTVLQKCHAQTTFIRTPASRRPSSPANLCISCTLSFPSFLLFFSLKQILARIWTGVERGWKEGGTLNIKLKCFFQRFEMEKIQQKYCSCYFLFRSHV